MQTIQGPTDIDRYRVDIPPPRYAESELPGIEPIRDAWDALAERYDLDTITEQEYERRAAELRQREAALRRRRDDAVADLDDELARLHEPFTLERGDTYHDTDAQLRRRWRAQAVHLLLLRRELLRCGSEGERRELYERERARPVEELLIEYEQPSSPGPMTREFQAASRFRDVAAEYVTVLVDRGRGDAALLESARQALTELRRWQRRREELREAYDEAEALMRSDELAVVGPLLDRLQAVGRAYVRLPGDGAVGRLRRALRSDAAARGLKVQTQVVQMRPGVCLAVSIQSSDADLRSLVSALWRSR